MKQYTFNLKDYVVVVENVITDKLCERILKEYENSTEWTNTQTGSGLNRDIRKCDALDISNKDVINKNLKERTEIDKYLYISASHAINKYTEKLNLNGEVSIQGDSGYTLLRYNENEFYTQHTDHFLQSPRIVSCSFALNDDYEGGEWGFWDRNYVVKVPKGAAIMFPSNFMFPHEIMPVKRRVRYSIITWFI